MVSKNNQHLKETLSSQQVPHYGLRKLGVGVASVLLGATLYFGMQPTNVQADTVDNSATSQDNDGTQNLQQPTVTLGQANNAQNATTDQQTTDSANSSQAAEPAANNTSSAQSNDSASANDPQAVATVTVDQPSINLRSNGSDNMKEKGTVTLTNVRAGDTFYINFQQDKLVNYISFDSIQTILARGGP